VPTVDEMIAAVEALAPTIAGRAPDIESARQVPQDLLHELQAAGCLRVLLPPSHGGAGASLAEAMAVFEAVAKADASTGWTVAIGASVWCDLAGLPRATFDMMYDHPDRVIAGVFSPGGTATPAADAYQIDGRWSFASGCTFADWLYGNAIEMVGGEPTFRTVLFRPDEVEIEDTWHVMGMRGTASHDFRAEKAIVPAGRTFSSFTAEPCVDDVIVHVPRPSLYALEIASVALGTARGALDDLLALTDKVPLLDQSPLAANRLFQHDLARADTELRAARCLLWACADEVWAAAETGSEPAAELVARTRAAAAWSTAIAAGVVQTAYRSGGGSSLYDQSPLQRRVRDVNVITQHFLVKLDTLTTAGALLAGQPIDIPVF
jgi:alkylation response protein AidB-like acyl-CoA dehydrogenase